MGGNDKITGSNGDDTLIGGTGNDKIKGNRGKDKFICLYGRDKILDYDADEGDTIEVSGNFTISVKKRKHSLISHEEGTVFVKKTIPNNLIINSSDSYEISTINPAEISNYLQSAKQSSLPKRPGNIIGTAGDDIIEVQRYSEGNIYFDQLRIGGGSDLLVFNKSPSFGIHRKGGEKIISTKYSLSEFDPLTGDKLLFDSNAFNKYEKVLATASSIEEVFVAAESSTSFIYFDDFLFYNENGSLPGFSIGLAENPAKPFAKFLTFLGLTKNLDSLSRAIEFI